MKQKQAGFALIEIILAVVIMGGFLMLSIKFYQSLRHDKEISQIKYNVDRIFGAAAEFYQANCRLQRDAVTGALIAPNPYGRLDPRNATTPVSPFPVTVTELRTEGYLNANLPANRYIDNATLNGGYIVQFNRAPDSDFRVDGNKMGNIVIWTAQVAVAIRSNVPLAIVRVLGADCAANATGTTVNPCSAAVPVNTGQPVYAVWERLPSFAVPNAEANTWMTNAQVKAFTLLYTNNNIQNSQPGPANIQTNYQNYLCGS